MGPIPLRERRTPRILADRANFKTSLSRFSTSPKPPPISMVQALQLDYLDGICGTTGIGVVTVGGGETAIPCPA